MDKEQLKKLAKNPRFIPGVYNYCDRWCERCPFTSRCMNYALSQEISDNLESHDISNNAFWNKLQESFEATMEMIQESAGEMDIDIDDIDYEEFERHEEEVHRIVKDQPYTKAAFAYVKMVDKWLESNKSLIEEKGDELLTLAQAQIPGAKPVENALKIQDCHEVIRWYQHQIYVKLCRAASGMIRGELEDNEYSPEDANGSAKVAIIGIERSMAAWARLLNQFPQQERSILDLLVHLRKMLLMIDESFPDARAFIRPGFDTPGKS